MLRNILFFISNYTLHVSVPNGHRQAIYTNHLNVYTVSSNCYNKKCIKMWSES
jgi:hypothetical protein